ncbi:MAG: phosphatidate cytidylyltransferase [Acidobacteriota bacterium]|nr:MAG: phosphatidate cytidylyltransferase [Acidobacteriota bacterium]
MARVITALVFLPILFAAVWIGSPVWFVVLAAIGIMLGLYEYFSLAHSGGLVQGLVAGAAILAAFYFQLHQAIVVVIVVLTIAELLIELWRNQAAEDFSHVLPAAAVRVFGVLYVALLGGHIIALRMIESPIPQLPAKLLTLFFLIVFAGDTFAYYTGRSIGRRKLAPRVSPGKTIEGAIGGLIGNALMAVIAHFTFFPELNLVHGIPLALVMGVLGITGDLCESMIKRGARAKDAGKLIPGHGGLLDRLDSMLFNAPVLYYFYLIFLKGI